MNPVIANHKKQIAALCKRYSVQKLYVFGSVLNDSFNEESDIDFLYEINNEAKDKSNFDYASNFFELEQELSKVLGRKVDLIRHDFKHVHPFLQAVGNKKKLLYAA